MGLLTTKDPCAICGGKLKAIFPWKIVGQLVCNDCHGVTDLPDGVEKKMTVEDFRAYMTFREENVQRKNQFEISKKIDFGWLDTKFLFDFKNHFLCMDKNLDKTIFEGKQIKSFVIREDDTPLFEGDANGLRRYISTVPERARALAPQLEQYRMHLEMERERERLRREHGDDTYHSGILFDIPEPFKQFVIEIQFEHPYWDFFHADMGGPTFDNSNPYVDDYLCSYEEKTKVIKLPKEKDMTDLAYAISKGKGKVFILGGIQGRRIEHFYSNILLMKRNPSIEMIDQFSHIFTIDEGEYYFPYDDYKFVSFFSLSKESVISLKGFKYDLEKYNLIDDDNLCISNEIYDGLVKVRSGRVLVIKSRDDA